MSEEIKRSIYEPIRSSVLILIVRLFLVMFVVDVIYSVAEVYFVDLDVAFDIHRFIITVMFITHFIKNMFLIYLVINIFIKWISSLYYISDNNLIKHEGIINIKERMIDLKNLRSVAIHQGLFGRLFHYGNITLTTSASGGYNDEINLSEIDRPERYKDFFQQCLGKSS